MNTSELYSSEEKCCGCGSCANACPKNAIEMTENDCGFLYPKINKNLCVDCNMCVKSCAFQNIQEKNTPLSVFATVRKDTKKLKASASGGMFAVIAEKFIMDGGVVFGCAMENDNDIFRPVHIKAETMHDLLRLQGSKYVQSNTGKTFREAKKCLTDGKKVLFCGTPCQVAGLKGYLKKDYENLFIIDLICHGVPSAKMFQDYITYTEKKRNIKITKFRFRAKTGKTGLLGEIKYTDKKGNQKKEIITPKVSSYYSYFLDADIYRKSCYSCPYACKNRAGDITAGDFWGFAKKYSDYDKEKFVPEHGISALIVNTQKGMDFLKVIEPEIYTYKSDYESVAERNPQLVRPSYKGKNYDKIMNAYRLSGYKGVEKLFAPRLLKYKAKQSIKKIIPESLIKKLKKAGK